MTDQIALPKPAHDGRTSVEAALWARRSVRDFSGGTLSLSEVSQLLWSAQGVSDRSGHRTAPSAGALYPLEIYLLAGQIEAVAQGVYKYEPRSHAVSMIADGDRRAELSRAALGQAWIAEAAAVIALAAVPERTAAKYGNRAERYVHIEIGHAGQNVYLQAGALGLGTTIVGAYDDERVKRVMAMARYEHPLCLLPIGRL